MLDWYQARLDAKQAWDVALWDRHIETLQLALENPTAEDLAARMGLADRMKKARAERERVGGAEYRESLVGTLGRQPV